MKKQITLECLMRQPVAWIQASAAQPNKFMSRTTILLHYVALRKLGVKL